MGRTSNVCGVGRATLRASFGVYETAMLRGPKVLGGPNEAAKGLAYDEVDRSKCYRVYVRPAWAPRTYWLSLQHHDGHWSAWPCIISWKTLETLLERWNAFSPLLWAVEGTREPLFDWPRVRHYGAKTFNPKNRITYTQGQCIGLARRGTKYAIVTRPYMHTLNGHNAPGARESDARDLGLVELLSCRPYDSMERIAELSAALGPTLSKAFAHEAWVEVDDVTITLALAPYFTAFTDELLSTVTWPNLIESKPSKKTDREDEEAEVTNALERLRAAKAEKEAERLRRELEALKAKLAEKESVRAERVAEQNASSFLPREDEALTEEEPAPEDEEPITFDEDSTL
jgi:hypothetical protein